MAKIIVQRSPDGAHTTGTDEAGNSAQMYLPEGSGGNHIGIRPMQMLLMGMGGCSAVDVLSILKKQRQEVEDLRIEIDGEREQGKEPSIWEKAHLKFYLKGPVDPEKAQRAVDLSMQKYCSATETLRRGGSNISWEVILLG
jgi:putative redox protein